MEREGGIARLGACMLGGYLDDVSDFDADLFGISPREARTIDPQHRMMLEETWSALHDAGIAPPALAGSRTGVFAGLCSMDYAMLAHEAGLQTSAYAGLGGAMSIGANRISYSLDLHGPSISVDAACASTLVCVHLATAALAAGDCDLAIVTGANLILAPTINVAFSKARMLSPTGRCNALQSSANGYVRSEAAGALVLQRLGDADPERLRAVIIGSAVGQDGRTPGISVPSRAQQVDLIRRAWSSANVDADAVDFIEAHATGTPRGDRLELDALGDVLAPRDRALPPCQVGGLKAAVGHAEAAAGLLSLAKLIHVLESGVVPAQPPATEFLAIPEGARGAMAIAERPTPLALHGERRRCVAASAFGFGGANCHVVLRACSKDRARPRTAAPVVFRRESYWLPHVPCPKAPPRAAPDSADCEVDFTALAYLRDHRIGQSIIVPGATLVDLAIREAVKRFGKPEWVAEGIEFHAAVALDEALGAQVTLKLSLSRGTADRVVFEFLRAGATEDGPSRRFASGTLLQAFQEQRS